MFFIVISGFGSSPEMLLLEYGNVGSRHLGASRLLRLGSVSNAYSKARRTD
jgi:hypothetical protein